MSYRPHMLVKIRSEKLTSAIAGMPCTLRVASLVPGYRCANGGTVVPAHFGKLGKGTGTKVSDLFVVAACLTCHDLIDRRDHHWQQIEEELPMVLVERYLAAIQETQSMLIQMGRIIIPNSTQI